MNFLSNLREKEDINALDKDRLTPLMRAFILGDYKEALQLIKKNPSLTITTYAGCTIFDIFWGTTFNAEQRKELAKKLIVLAFNQNILAVVPHEIKVYALKDAHPEFAIFLHIVARSKETEHAVNKLKLYWPESHILNQGAKNREELLKLSMGSFFVFYLFWLFINKLRLQAPNIGSS